MPGSAPHLPLLLCALIGIIGLILLIVWGRVHAFVALILASVFVGLSSGMSLSKVAEAFQEGVGSMLGAIAVVVGLGMILGRLLADSGGAEVIARTLIRAGGEERLPWTMMLIGFLVGIPVFFTVGVVLLAPILYTLVQETKRPLLQLGLPMVAGLSVVHGLVPPHPGPMAAIGILKADAGRVILWSLLIGLPTAIVAGPLYARFVSQRVLLDSGFPAAKGQAILNRRCPPGFGISVLTILLPVLLMMLGTIADLALSQDHVARPALKFIGSPVIAMLGACLFGFYSFGLARGFSREELLKMAEGSLGPAAAILLVVGAGGGFNRVLITSGVGDALAAAAQSARLSPLILGWVLAAAIRAATGSATVAITTAAGMLAPLVSKEGGVNVELLVLSMGAGSLVLSHVNDGGFWFVKEYFGTTVAQTLRTWTVLETIISLTALGLVLILDLLRVG